VAPRQAYEVEVHAHGKNKKVIWSTTFYITKEYESSGRITFAVKGITPERDILHATHAWTSQLIFHNVGLDSPHVTPQTMKHFIQQRVPQFSTNSSNQVNPIKRRN
jgi:hypothetical protein